MSAFRYLSVCSGIEAATVAWGPLGWRAAAFSEIERFPRAVLKHHYPSVPLHGDFTTIKGDEYGSVDLLVGGTPCQSFSVAGLRKGMDDDRGNLALEYLRLAARLNARWLVWENVPGVLSSNGGRDFGAFLGGLAELGYGWAYRVLDAQYAGVPQRRRRVFVVGYLGDWRRAAAVLFERHSLQGHSPPRREAGERATGRLARSVAIRGRAGGGTAELGDEAAHALRASQGGGDKAHILIGYRMQAFGEYEADGTASAMKARDYKDATDLIAHTLRADGFDASEDGTGRGTPLVPTFAIQERAVCENPNAGPDGVGVRGDGMAYTLEARTQQQAVAFQSRASASQSMNPSPVAPTLDVGKGDGMAVAFRDVAAALTSNYAKQPDNSNTGLGPNLVGQAMAVRRITPVEAERLMGFPDGYTAIPWRGKPAEACPDGPRYKALGNSMAVPVMRWIGERIQMVEAIARDEARRVA